MPNTKGKGLNDIAFCRKIAQLGVIAKSCKKAKPGKLSLRSCNSFPALIPLLGLSTVANCDQLIVLEKGVIVKQGSPTDILGDDILK